ncbi:class I SAM-dependent methyltransferase [Streptantibioticus rubrisoli]|uniref:class I SAM-dependent methyltransferase n=1 Tax=Streptantibioticus rubrisoli TaxID=1387313 RepID=UPI0027E39B58|nr:methyltransferase domain-containing protein [Streptantibioticus rubrisoli]
MLGEHTPVPDGGGRALDVGCGTGALAAYLASLGYMVDAVDFADSALVRARNNRGRESKAYSISSAGWPMRWLAASATTRAWAGAFGGECDVRVVKGCAACGVRPFPAKLAATPTLEPPAGAVGPTRRR